MLINMHTLEAAAGRDDVSRSLKGIIKPRWKQWSEISPFIARCDTKPEVLSKNNGNACALTLKTWLYLSMQTQADIALRSSLGKWTDD